MTTFSKEQKKILYDYFLKYWVKAIKDVTIRERVKWALKAAPDYFWTKSSDHDRSPADEHTHGMLKRVWKTAYFAKQIAKEWELRQLQDEIIAASLLHDLQKYEAPDKSQHGPFTAEWLKSIWKLEELFDAEADKLEAPTILENLNFILEVILLHDGRVWTKQKLLKPIGNNLEKYEEVAWLIHTAEFVASREKTIFEWSM